MNALSRNKWWLVFSLALIFTPLFGYAEGTYPKLANYYLKYFQLIPEQDYEALKKWDLLIIPNELSAYNPQFLESYKRAKPEGKLFAYTYPSMALNLPHTLYSQIDQRNLWLRDGNGNKIQMWSNIYAANITKSEWQRMNLDFVDSKMNQGPWDGIFYDMVEANIDRHSSSGIDITGDGVVDSSETVSRNWQQGMSSLFAQTRQRFPNKLIIMNGTRDDFYQPNVNGRMFESFPPFWEGNWQSSMYQYLRRLPGMNRQPLIYVINANTSNSGAMTNYQKMRFGLTSTLLGEGYFSFDHGDQAHEQVWWYDEYDVKLGKAQSTYYNLLEPGSDYIKPGLWRRDFDNGIALVNSTAKDQLYIFRKEEFEKIRGRQDPLTNNGTRINYIKLKPNDGIILKTTRQDLVGSTFLNGDFVRVFDATGKQTQNGFFTYKSDTETNARVAIVDLDGNGQLDRVTEKNGKIVVSGPGRKTVTIAPFGLQFKGKLSFAVGDFNKDDQQEIVIAPLTSGGPQVVIYSHTGKQLSAGFFALDKNFRGGLQLAVADTDNDGKLEIITAPAKDSTPLVKIYSEKGKVIGSFLAYDKNFKGGVTLAAGDLNQDGRTEIITGAASSGPHIRIFKPTGQLVGQFMAFDPKAGGGVRVMTADINGDGKLEILGGNSNF